MEMPSLSEFLLTASDLLNLHLSARLVVISSSHSHDHHGWATSDGIVTLTRALLVAGAQCVLISLWPVPDTATKILLRAFYSALLQVSYQFGYTAWLWRLDVWREVHAVLPLPQLHCAESCTLLGCAVISEIELTCCLHLQGRLFYPEHEVADPSECPYLSLKLCGITWQNTACVIHLSCRGYFCLWQYTW